MSESAAVIDITDELNTRATADLVATWCAMTSGEQLAIVFKLMDENDALQRLAMCQGDDALAAMTDWMRSHGAAVSATPA